MGGAGLVVGSVAGVLAMGKHGELEESCAPNGACPESQQGTLDSFRTLGAVSTAGFIVAGVGAAAGVTLLLTSSDEPETPGQSASPARPRLSLHGGLGQVSLRGRF